MKSINNYLNYRMEFNPNLVFHYILHTVLREKVNTLHYITILIYH